MLRFSECHFLLSVIAKFLALAHSIFGIIIAKKNIVQVTWHSAMQSSGNFPLQTFTVNSWSSTTSQPNMSDGWTVGVIGNVSNLCTVFYGCWYSIVHNILVACPWVCQLKVVWFVVLIPVICYSCSSWLEDHCNFVLKNMKLKKETSMNTTIFTKFWRVLDAFSWCALCCL
jgi:hypothetical protein